MDIKLKYKFRSHWGDVVIMENDFPEIAARKLLHDSIFQRLDHLYDGFYDIWYSEDQNSQQYRVEMERTPILEINGAHYILTQDFQNDSVII